LSDIYVAADKAKIPPLFFEILDYDDFIQLFLSQKADIKEISMKHFSFLLVVLAFLLTACAPASGGPVAAQNGIEIYGPWARAAVTDVSGAYMLIKNTASAADKLVSVSSDVAEMVQIHETTMDNGVMSMREVPGGLEIPAGGEAILKPGGYHIMLMGLKRELKAGEAISVTLVFENAGEITVNVPVSDQ